MSCLVVIYLATKSSFSALKLLHRAGLPVSNDDTDSNKSGSSRSDPSNHVGSYGSLLYHHPTHHHTHLAGQGAKGKQLPKGIYLNTMELLELSNDEDNANARRLDRWEWGAIMGGGGLGYYVEEVILQRFLVSLL